MFGFPTDLFGIRAGNNRPASSNSLVPQHHSLFGNGLMMPSPFMAPPFGGLSGVFDEFSVASSPFSMMDRMMRGTNSSLFLGGSNQTSAPMHSFTSTTVMSYNGADGRPKVYQESTSHSRGPGGLEETRQAIRDSERGISKVQIGHRIGDRKHVVEREMNVETGQMSENLELENLDEDETDDFKREWRQRSGHAGLQRHPNHHHHHFHRQLASNRLHHAAPQQPQLAIEHTPSTGTPNRHPSKSVKRVHTAPPQATIQHSDTIDLTEDTPHDDEVKEIEQLPLPEPVSVKRKASHSSEADTPRKHRQNRF